MNQGLRTRDLALREPLALPVYPELSAQQAKFVVDSVQTFFTGKL
jgi:dTDP-4-amino-4,6-dideoxygalactose transaminase